jgi:hypothetical protein
MFDKLKNILINKCSTLSSEMNFMHRKNFKASVLVFMLLTALAESSIADNWVRVATTANAKLYIDTQSLKRSGSNIEVWEKWVYVKPQELKDASKRTYQARRELVVINCNERTAYIESIILNADRNPLSTIVENWIRPDIPAEYDNVTPETLDVVCRVTAPEK